MRIRKIHVCNFRNLKNVCIFPSKTTIIVGENDAGKSNFLHALRLLLDPQAEHLRIDLSEADICDESKKNGEYWFSILIEVGDLQKHVDIETCFKERLSQDGDETYVTIQGTYQKDDTGDYAFSINLQPPAGRYNEPIVMKPRMFRSIPIHYLDAQRNADRDLRASGRSVLGQLISEVDFSDVEVDVQKYLHSANEALNKGKDVNVLSNGISSQFTQLVPGGQSRVKLTVNDEDPLSIRRGLRLSIEKNPNSGLSDVSRHGTGLQNLALVALFRHRVANSKFGVPILAVEEPEAHIHTHAQRRLFRDLDATDAPVIITTHSTAIVKNADPLSLVLFRTIDEHTVPFQLDKKRIGKDDLSNLSQLVRGGRSELFFARSIVIVEGESELLTFPAFANTLGCDLDREGISLIDAGSNNFAYILKSCNDAHFSIPNVVVYDTDVIAENHNLVREAYKAGLINQETRDSWNKVTGKTPQEVRRSILDSLGWFPAEECFEEEIARSGYLRTMVKAIIDEDPDNRSDFKAFRKVLKDENLELNSRSIALFIKKRPTLKIPVARAVANAVQRFGKVPPCYANAIRKAILLSQNGIVIDDYFESRSYCSGFKDVIIHVLETQGAMSEFNKFMTEENVEHQILGVQRFFTDTAVGKASRPILRLAIADATELCGCSDYANNIRNSNN